MIKDKERFCKDLKDFFKIKNLKYQDIAERLGVSPSYVGTILSGNKAFGKSAAEKWAEEFGLSAAWLLTGEGEMTPCSVHQENVNGDNVHGDGVTINKTDSELIALIKKRDEQIDRLLSIIEHMQK